MKNIYCEFILFYLYICNVESHPPTEILHPEINDQFENVTIFINETTSTDKPDNLTQSQELDEILDGEGQITANTFTNDDASVNQSVMNNFYKIIKGQVTKFIETPKINTVLRNIGTCIVNGMMEIVSYYFPAPFIPLIASAAGMVIPFEPVVMLRRRMPVTSYRRAIKTALNGFLNTFNAYKFDEYDEDPYMTRRFNRRFMNEISKETTNKDGV